MLNFCSTAVTHDLFATGFIGFEMVAISFEPTVGVDDVSGELTFGGVDTSKFIGDINVAYVSLLLCVFIQIIDSQQPFYDYFTIVPVLWD